MSSLDCFLTHWRLEETSDMKNIWSTAAKCLIIGAEYKSLFDLAKQLGDVKLGLFALIINREVSRFVHPNFLFEIVCDRTLNNKQTCCKPALIEQSFEFFLFCSMLICLLMLSVIIANQVLTTRDFWHT